MELKMVKLHSSLLLPTFKVFTAHLGVSLDYTLHFIESVVELDEDEQWMECVLYEFISILSVSSWCIVFLTTRNVEFRIYDKRLIYTLFMVCAFVGDCL
jgi:hypothetical protein